MISALIDGTRPPNSPRAKRLRQVSGAPPAGGWRGAGGGGGAPGAGEMGGHDRLPVSGGHGVCRPGGHGGKDGEEDDGWGEVAGREETRHVGTDAAGHRCRRRRDGGSGGSAGA